MHQIVLLAAALLMPFPIGAPPESGKAPPLAKLIDAVHQSVRGKTELNAKDRQAAEERVLRRKAVVSLDAIHVEKPRKDKPASEGLVAKGTCEVRRGSRERYTTNREKKRLKKIEEELETLKGGVEVKVEGGDEKTKEAAAELERRLNEEFKKQRGALIKERNKIRSRAAKRRNACETVDVTVKFSESLGQQVDWDRANKVGRQELWVNVDEVTWDVEPEELGGQARIAAVKATVVWVPAEPRK